MQSLIPLRANEIPLSKLANPSLCACLLFAYCMALVAVDKYFTWVPLSLLSDDIAKGVSDSDVILKSHTIESRERCNNLNTASTKAFLQYLSVRSNKYLSASMLPIVNKSLTRYCDAREIVDPVMISACVGFILSIFLYLLAFWRSRIMYARAGVIISTLSCFCVILAASCVIWVPSDKSFKFGTGRIILCVVGAILITANVYAGFFRRFFSKKASFTRKTTPDEFSIEDPTEIKIKKGKSRH